MIKAEKGVVSDLVGIFILMMSVILIVSVSLLMFQVSQNDEFLKSSSDVISRYGGYTKEAAVEIQKISDSLFNGRYTVVTPVQNKQSYGTMIKYEVQSNVKMVGFNLSGKLLNGFVTISKKR